MKIIITAHHSLRGHECILSDQLHLESPPTFVVEMMLACFFSAAGVVT